ncbi:hypothetical protein [Streptomyces afghaniensis]|uniref:hypothetical protein n=1 Tax=Streptomyces afghaniensis TaxID=66865 RepID=UPI002783396D|nr:hypothetical protein [Streptomyces afghaniensis]MDQ1019863.1 5-methylcytosine-specific restriction endonuclease McrA [Streptomyces afghaniensis]
MRSLPAPSLSARTLYRACISTAIRRHKQRLEALEQDVVDASDEFEAAARAAALHTLKDLAKKPADEADRTQLTNTYTDRLVPERSVGNAFYAKLKRVPHQICPLCGHRDVSTLDHQLPKMKYPLLAVAPINLVPACGICNWLKGEHVPETASEQTLHPYYDDVADQQWLFTRLKWVESRPPEVTYFIHPPQGADCVLAARVIRHFQMFRLAELYGPNAVREMSNIRGILRGMTAAGRRKYLLLAEHSILIDKDAGGQNHWKRALFQTLAGDSGYLEGGFDQF